MRKTIFLFALLAVCQLQQSIAQSYLPLTGGTLTGPLTGTSVNFAANYNSGYAAIITNSHPSGYGVLIQGSNNATPSLRILNASSGLALDVTGNDMTVGGSTKFGTHDAFNFYTFERYASGHPFATLRAGELDNNVAAGFHFQTRISDGTVIDAVSMSGAGDVGIGTTNPGNILAIYKSGGEQYTQWYSSSTGTGSTDGLRIGLDASSNAIIDNNEGTNITIKNNGSTAVTIDNAQNVGIGTTNPGSFKLAVNGHVRAKEIKVDTDWSDFVFEPDYKLLSLKETEEYIKKNKHLPEIPSAKEVEKDGINVGEMNAKLLQKIEELTLHLIGQNKIQEVMINEIKQLKSEISQLKSKP